jgi:hypothetical protein
MFVAVLETEQSMQRLVALDARIPPLQDNRPTNEYFFLRRLVDRRIPLGLFGGNATRLFREAR